MKSFTMKKNSDKYIGGYVGYSTFFKFFIILGIVLTASVFIYYTQDVVSELKADAQRVVNVYAKLWQLAASEATSGVEISLIFDEIISKSNFPIVVTDIKGEPVAWREIDIELTDTTTASRERLKKIIKEMDGEKEPIPIYYGEKKQVINYLHYGDPILVKQLWLMPFVEVGVLTLFILIALISFTNIKRSQQRSIWVGMAKETAHQLGTPITSLMGWEELLESKCSGEEKEIKPVIEQMKIDIKRLEKVANRFSQIGSLPELKEGDLNNVVAESVAYYRKRIPQTGAGIELKENLGELVRIKINKELLGWVIENLIKNALEAVNAQEGKIEVSTCLDKERQIVNVIVTDNGKGIPWRNQKKVFDPGFTTKKRGWGLGLSLAKRIVGDYHGGKLYLKESVPSEKTTFVVSLPIS
jgi:hypothetical protein